MLLSKLLRKNLPEISVVLVLVCYKQLMAHWLPCHVVDAPFDDRLMVRLAESLSAGSWLGDYDRFTLVKGVGFPLLLAGAHTWNISYMDLVQFLYSMSCTIFVIALRDLLPSRQQRLALFCVLLFAPVMTSIENVQRVYRCSITPPLVLLLFGSLYRLFYYVSNKRKPSSMAYMTLWSILGGTALVLLWNTREDGVWLLPALGIALTMCVVVSVRRRGFAQTVPFVLILLLLPGLLAASIFTISSINKEYYGQNLTLELSGGNFPRAIRALYSIAPEEGDEEPGPRVSVSDKILARAIDACPSLESVKDEIWNMWEVWKGAGGDPNDQVKNGWFFWSFRDAAAFAGLYDNPQSSEEFYERVASEIEQTIASGKLHERPTMPSALLPPYKKGNLGNLIRAAASCVIHVASSDKCQSLLVESDLENPAVQDSAGYVKALVLAKGESPSWKTTTDVTACNAVAMAYRLISPLLGIVGMAGFIGLFVRALRAARSKDDKSHALAAMEYAKLAFMLVVLMAFLTLVAGLAYTDVFSFDAAKSTMYASAAYPLYLSFGVLGTIFAVEQCRNIKQKRRRGAHF